MTNILSQEEVDALLRGISGGEIETEKDEYHEPGAILAYDLTSQDRIIRGRMPTLEMTNEKYARTFRATLSSILRKVISVTAVSADMIKFGEFLKTLPVPTSLHLFRMDPMRGNAIFVVESKIIFTLVNQYATPIIHIQLKCVKCPQCRNIPCIIIAITIRNTPYMSLH